MSDDRFMTITDDEIFAELERRFDSVCVVGRKSLTTDGEKWQSRRFWSGDLDVCAGLSASIVQSISNQRWGVDSEDLKYD